MKNLKLVTEASLQLDLLSEGESLLISSFDIENNRLFFASSSNLIYTLNLPSSHGTEWSKSMLGSEPGLVDLEPGDSIIAMDYLMEKEALLIGSTHGSLVLYNTDEKSIELVGQIEGGIKSIASSPDGSFISVSTKLGQLLTMTHDWEVLYENSLNPPIPEKEKDFFIPEYPPNEINFPIAWRGDGKYFATINESNRLLIFERDSEKLHAMCPFKNKKIPNTLTSIDWMPSGAKIATGCDRGDEKKTPLVIFFERNGLERNSFELDGPVDSVLETLNWNCNSDLLAGSITSSIYDAIKIWYFCNNHWYLKHEMRFSKEDKVKFFWDPTKPLNLISWTITGKVTLYKFISVSAVSEANSISLVIDGSKILITPLNFSLMPPPMSLFSFNFRAPVINVSYFSQNSKNFLAVNLSDNSFSVVDLPDSDKWDQFEGNEIIISNYSQNNNNDNNNNNNLLHLNWLDMNSLIGVSSLSLQEIEVSNGESKNETRIENSVISIIPNPLNKGSVFIQFNGGKIIDYPFEFSNRDFFNSELGFPLSCPWMKSALCVENGNFRVLILGLDEIGRLYMGKKVLCNNCTSFAFYYGGDDSAKQITTHVLFTTKQDILFVMDINDILHGNLDLKIDNYIPNNNNNYRKKESIESRDYIHIWEKGAKITGVLHGDESAIILQTNRGNLESIYPRKLVLNSIINSLIQNRFKNALIMVRRHRIDFNFIVDYLGLKDFIKHANDFITQVDNLSHITEFICAINKENVIEKLYKIYISNPNRDDNSSEKITLVLTAIRKALEEKLPECPSRELCILTTLAKSEPPLIEEALKRIKAVREFEISGDENTKTKTHPSSQESLKHLLWLTDSEFVFNAALGLYDLNLAAMVALNSQKDPKEFIPYLKGLEELSNYVMKYTIDLKLGRNESAMRNIFLSGDNCWDKFMNLLNGNPDLFPLGLQLVNDQTEKKQELLEAWGDYLYSNKSFEKAASTYLCAKSYHKSMKSYRDNGNWRSVLTLAGLLKFEKIQIISLANELCEEFQALGKPCEAARIALEYLDDVERGIGFLIIAREWEEALRVAVAEEREDLEREVVSGGIEWGKQLIAECEENGVKVGKYLARYLAVRQRRLVLQAKIKSEENNIVNGDLNYDSVSEISTSFSDMSAYTTRSARDSVASSSARSARSSRQQKKKAGKIRAGSAGEEFALVDHLKGMALTPSAQREIKSLLITLLSVGKDEIAFQVQNCVDSFELTQKAAVKLTEDMIGNEIIDEASHTLENYVRISKAEPREEMNWQIEAFVPPQQVID